MKAEVLENFQVSGLDSRQIFPETVRLPYSLNT